MKIGDLKVGDYVLVDSEISRVTGVDERTECVSCTGEKKEADVPIKCVEKIELDLDTLGHFGFLIDTPSPNCLCTMKSREYFVSVNLACYNLMVIKYPYTIVLNMNIKDCGIHELQHILRLYGMKIK